MNQHNATKSAPADEEISIYALLRLVLERRYLLATAALGTAVLVVAFALIGERDYTARAAFLPQTSSTGRNVSGLAALAGQFGFALPQADAVQSPQFYAELLVNREILGRLLADTFRLAPDERTGAPQARGTLADFLDIDEDDPALRREESLIALRNALEVSTQRETGMVNFAVTTHDPRLSRAAAARLLDLVNEFNLETRQTNAAAESRFIEERLKERAASLRDAEGHLRSFLESNRQFRNSPELGFEHDRLQRQVTYEQEIYTGLQQSLESARIAEVRDTPVITVVEPPLEPARPDSRRVPMRALLGLLAGTVVGLIGAIGLELAGSASKSGDPEYQRMRAAWSDVRADLRRRLGRPRASTLNEG